MSRAQVLSRTPIGIFTDTSGNVGVGTGSPIAKFQVVGQIFAGNTTTSSKVTYLQTNSTYGIVEAYDFSGGGAMPLVINPNGGNVGIGTSSPGARLHVTTGATGVQALFANGSGTPTIAIGNSATNYNLQLGYNVVSEYGYIQATAATGVADDIVINPNGGNLGLGVTPSVWSNGKAIEVGVLGSSFWGFAQNETYMLSNTYFNGGWKYAGTGTATRYAQISGQHVWSTATSGTAGNAISFTQVMTLDASGNLGVGRTATAVAAYRMLELDGVSGGYMRHYVNGTLSGSWYTGSGSGGIGTVTAIPFVLSTSDTERMRITATGDVGIGTSSPAQSWTGGAAKTVQVQNASSGITVLRLNDSAGTSGDLQLISSTSADTGIYNFANGAMRFGTNGAERMRIDSSGRLGLGTTSPAYNLHIKSASPAIHLEGVLGTGGVHRIESSGGNDTTLAIRAAQALYLTVNGADRVIIDSSGNLLVGNTSTLISTTAGGSITVGGGGSGNTNTGQIALNGSTASGYGSAVIGYANGALAWGVGEYGNFNASTSTFLTCRNTGGGVYLNGASATAWTAVSDERLKENLEPITDATRKVLTLRAVIGNYKWDEEKVKRPFLIAQDVLAVLPEAVAQTNPDELGVSYTDVIPLLVAAIKEQQAVIEDMKSRLAAAGI